MKILYFQGVGGASGDMILAALADGTVDAIEFDGLGGIAKAEGTDGNVMKIWLPAASCSTLLVVKPTAHEAVAAAAAAYPAWRDTPLPARVQVMFQFKQLVEHVDILFANEG